MALLALLGCSNQPLADDGNPDAPDVVDTGAPPETSFADTASDPGLDTGSGFGDGALRVEYVRRLWKGIYNPQYSDTAESVRWTGRYFVVWGSCTTAGEGGMHVFDAEGTEVDARSLCRDSERARAYDHQWQVGPDFDLVDADSWFMSMGRRSPRSGVLYEVAGSGGSRSVEIVGRSSRGQDYVDQQGLLVYTAAKRAAVFDDKVLIYEKRTAADASVTYDDPRLGDFEALYQLPSMNQLWERRATMYPTLGFDGGVVIGVTIGTSTDAEYYQFADDDVVPTGDEALLGVPGLYGERMVGAHGLEQTEAGFVYPHYDRIGDRFERAGEHAVAWDSRVAGLSLAGEFLMHEWNVWHREVPVSMPAPGDVLPEYAPQEGEALMNVLGAAISEDGKIVVVTGSGVHLLEVVPDE
jgi:hypothetical protein